MEAIAVKEKQDIQNVEDYAMQPDQMVRQVALIQNVMSSVMRDGTHFGKIPGCGDKPTLLKPGAEKLCLTFRLSPKYDINCSDLPGGHREYDVVCNLTSIVTGVFIGSGVGCCSTMETKYRYRKADLVCPTCGKATIIKGKQEFGGGWLCYGKKGGCGKKWTDDNNPFDAVSERVEHDNPADYYNTVKKMAIKRALVSAVLQATAASDIFTQDIEELVENGVITPKEESHPETQKKQPQPQQKTGDSKKVSEGQVKLIYAQAGKLKDKDACIEAIKSLYGVEHITDMPAAEMNNVLDIIKDRNEEGA